MKIAMLTVTRNDDYRFEEWCKYYEGYKDEIDLHIICDDASEEAYLNKIKFFFKNSIILHRKINGGSNAALNDGLRYVLSDKSIDAIMVLDNDIELKKGSIKALYNYLFSDVQLAMVGPVVLTRNSDIVENFGVMLSVFSSSFLFKGQKLNTIAKNISKYVDIVPGGINMAKRSLYETVGLQDEAIFMYCDERDMCYRIKKNKLQEGVISNAIAWHQHKYCPPQGKRLRSLFLTERNRIYLQRKYKGIIPAFVSAFGKILLYSVHILKHITNEHMRFEYKQRVLGLWAGVSNNMDNTNVWY